MGTWPRGRGSIRICYVAIGGASMLAGVVGAPAHGQSERPVDYHALANEILEVHNRIRENPAAFVSALSNWRTSFEGHLRHQPGQPSLRTVEGRSAVEEAIRFLRRQEPVKPLRAWSGMDRAAQDHVARQGQDGRLGHEGSDGSMPWDRVSRYGVWVGAVAENISYGPADAEEVVLQLVVDDGVRDRGHRTNIFDPRFGAAGAACGPHATYRVMCVVIYAGAFANQEPRD